MIELTGLTKRYGRTVAVDDLTFTVQPGQVTGFLGPNGAGKSTTMRMIIGLDRPTSGTVTLDGTRYRDHAAPLHLVGALLDAKALHKGRSADSHLRALAQTHGIPDRRVAEVLAMTGLTEVAHRRVGGYSLGMAQRLGVAAALLGDPGTLILDEPVNGLDPDGVLWIRSLLQRLATEGRTVLVSSHLMSEMAVTAGHLLIIGRGRLLADTSVAELIGRFGVGQVRVRSPQAAQLADLVAAAGATVSSDTADTLEVTGLGAETIGLLARDHHLPVLELAPRRASLEEAYMELTRDAVEYHDQAGARR
jgi:ABC-2 type transport system ATP-binding protein